MGGKAVLVSNQVRQEISQLKNIDHYVSSLFFLCFSFLATTSSHYSTPFTKKVLAFLNKFTIHGFSWFHFLKIL